ncbi:hypothetical protein M6D93_04075 [Jatrophihabitans telluris]|uniref:Uncharacterized protein n=1 Tax=Jatrophihabitans telluris TaxID=2038343 RepID=A0ABY4QZU9_9ACTN|nr:hypothetical protein [Jatrophihabitans telluris]UQX89186.1 hypothetical protein M6D93_04075 [Jatrophihabitans telluris]
MKIFLCVACNSYFNETLEIPCRPIITSLMQADSVTLDVTDQTNLAAYFTKLSLLMALWPHYPDGMDPFIGLTDMRTFRQGLVLPAGTRIWLGCIEDANLRREQAVMRAIPESFTREARESQWLLPAGSSCHLASFDHLFAVLFWMRRDPLRGGQPAIDARVMISKAERAGLVHRIWPNRGTRLVWPPPLAFDAATYAHWSNRFGYVPPGTRPKINTPNGLPDWAARSLAHWESLPTSRLAADQAEDHG